uniref:Uncharacterized protein n=1 Tax=Oryza brachyantha TaxID=4533 RepID=J3NC84_ORYBR
MAIFKKDGAPVLFILSLMIITAMVLPSCQASAQYRVNCGDLTRCTENACVDDCRRRGYPASPALVYCMDGRPDQCCCKYVLGHHPN